MMYIVIIQLIALALLVAAWLRGKAYDRELDRFWTACPNALANDGKRGDPAKRC